MRKFGLSLVIGLTMTVMTATAAFAAHSNENTAPTNEYKSAQLGIAGNQTVVLDPTPDRGGDGKVLPTDPDLLANKHYAVTQGDVKNPSDLTQTASLDCAYCHENQTKHTSGPHGGYTTTTNRCLTCHGLHARPEGQNKAWSARLLPGETTVEVCNFCHDLTQSDLGPYFGHYMDGKTYENDPTKARVVKSAHRVTGVSVYSAPAALAKGFEKYNDTFNKADLLIPGGGYADGGDRALVTSGQGALTGNAFTCDSCHTPHAVPGATVDPYLGESHIKVSGFTANIKVDTDTTPGGEKTISKDLVFRVYLTDRLLKARVEDPNKTRTDVRRVYTQYSSNWCASCHMGRFANDPVTGEDTIHNHPVSMNTMNWAAAGDIEQQDNARAEGYKFLNWADYRGSQTKATLLAAAGMDAKGIQPQFVGLYNDAVQDLYGAVYDSYLYSSGKPIYFNADPRTNKQYAMTKYDALTGADRDVVADGYDPLVQTAGVWGDITAVSTNGPSCQQCHGSARDVEKSFEVFADEVHEENYAMNFPHVSENKALLVEEGDDFCTNCHGLDNLP